MEMITSKEYMPTLADDIDFSKYGIAMVGCGTIANQAHLPAYRKHGLNVVACCDIDEEAARSTAETFDIPYWTTNIHQLLDMDEVKIIDLAVFPHVRFDILKQIAQSPRPVLTQKPLAMDLQEAVQLAELAENSGIMLGVNQQARWAPAHQAMKILLDQGTIGDVYSIHHNMRSFQDQEGWWWTRMKNFNIVDHGIHYLDLCRFLSSSPSVKYSDWKRLNCITAQVAEQNSISPLIYSTNVEFGPIGGRNEMMASLFFNNIARAKRLHGYSWWIDGTEGSICCHQNKIMVSLAKEPSTLHEIKLKGSWFPDGFAGSMIDFITSIDRGEAPPVTPQDNYNTIAMTNAMVISSKQGRVVEKEEMFAEVDSLKQA